jgi:hypothetical protein
MSDNTYTPLPVRTILDVPSFRQNDNLIAPRQTCNTTCMAMVAYYHGFRGDNSYAQLEDQFTDSMRKLGYSRYDMEHMAKFLNEYGRRSASMTALFNQSFSVNKLIETLSLGIPVIVSGAFTPSWHFIVLRGYDSARKVFLVNDPNGEFWQRGYDVDMSNGIEEYSFALISHMCNDDGRADTIWGIAVSGDGTAYYKQRVKERSNVLPTREAWDKVLNSVG